MPVVAEFGPWSAMVNGNDNGNGNGNGKGPWSPIPSKRHSFRSFKAAKLIL
jgi:hypothetical protein